MAPSGSGKRWGIRKTRAVLMSCPVATDSGLGR